MTSFLFKTKVPLATKTTVIHSFKTHSRVHQQIKHLHQAADLGSERRPTKPAAWPVRRGWWRQTARSVLVGRRLGRLPVQLHRLRREARWRGQPCAESAINRTLSNKRMMDGRTYPRAFCSRSRSVTVANRRRRSFASSRSTCMKLAPG